MEAKEVNITYETLFEILKREKDRTDLQRLEPTIFIDFVSYIKEKGSVLGKNDNIFPYDEKRKVEKQIENAKRIIKEIYDRREKKILNLALIKSRTKSNIVDTSPFLPNEKKFFEESVRIINNFRSEIIDKVIIGDYAIKSEVKENKEEKAPDIDGKKTKLIRFLHSVPKFVGKELEDYGPFVEEDIANLPTEIADLLISKGRVEEIKGD